MSADHNLQSVESVRSDVRFDAQADIGELMQQVRPQPTEPERERPRTIIVPATGKRRFKIAAGLVLLASVLAFAVTRNSATPENGDLGEYITDVARTRPLKITVTEMGAIDSSNNAIVVSDVEWKTTIIRLVPEGTKVKAGDVICELDTADLLERLKEREILLEEAESRLDQSREDVGIQRTKNDSSIADAELRLRLAKLDSEMFKKGEFPQSKNDIEAELTLAKEDQTRALENYEFTKRMVKKGYRSQSDLETARLAVTKAEISLESADDKRMLLDDFTYTRRTAELDANAKEYERRLGRAKIQTDAALKQATIRVKSYERTAESRLKYVERLKRNIADCTIRAPQDGQVVYANSSSSRRSSRDNTIEEGASIQYQQEIIKLPDLTRMKVDARIHESKINMVKKGLPVAIRVDAFSDEEFHGTIDFISSVPLSGRWPNSDLKEYEAVITITDPTERVTKLRPGLTAEIEIQVSQRDSVLQVPVQSVVGVADRQVAWVLTPGGAQRRQVVVGESNETAVEILDGLADGERVVLNPRTRFADQLAELEERAAASTAVKDSDAAE